MFSLCFNLLNRSMPGQAKSKVDVRSGGQRQHRSTGVAEAAAWVLVTPLRNCSLSVRYSLGSRDLRDINQISASFVVAETSASWPDLLWLLPLTAGCVMYGTALPFEATLGPL